MTPKQEFLAECIVNDLVLWLVQEQNLSMEDAYALVCNSQTFEKLQTPATGLYAESSAYNYELLSAEMKNGCFVQEDF